MEIISKSRYHVIVLTLYLFLVFGIFILLPEKIHYDFSFDNFGVIFLLISYVFLIFYFLKTRKEERKLSKILTSTTYGIIFAFPEEIIFRGVILQAIEEYYNNIFIAILLSSIIFGLAHLLNGAKDLSPKNLNWELAAITFCAGIPLGLSFALTQNLLVPTILHALMIIALKLFKDLK